jgi:16S rRNA (cytosine967-C5)-methyltransferase
VRAEELPHGIAPAADGTVRTLPGMLADAGGCDGFFVARLRRAGD